MPVTRTQEITVYKFNELSDKAKEKAREWYRKGALSYVWWDAVYEDIKHVATRLGIEFSNKKNENSTPAIYFSGFCSQGDGASFEGCWSHKAKPQLTSPDAVFRRKALNTDERHASFEQAIKDYAPKDEKLIYIARELDTFTNYSCRIITSGRYSHEYAMNFTHYAKVSKYHHIAHETGRYSVDIDEVEENNFTKRVEETLRNFARWIYRQLEKEYDYLNSNEFIDESILTNNYKFDEDGNVA